MTTLVEVAAGLSAAVNLTAGALGAWAFYRVQTSRAFWWVLRAGQLCAVLLAVVVGVLAATGREPREDLFYLYALLPLAVAFVGEQLRIASAQTVLDTRELPDAAAVGRLPAERQRSVVMAIVRREMGVMTLAALVVCFLELRALGTAGY
jgi:hypothetical protein